MKICKNCKHYKLTKETQSINYAYGTSWVTLIPEKHECKRSSSQSLVTGEYLEPYLDCNAEREYALRLEQFRCGPHGKYWEPK